MTQVDGSGGKEAGLAEATVRRASGDLGVVGGPGSAEFGPFLAIYDALVARFGVAADERFTAVLNSITKAAAVQCGVQCGVPHPPTDRGGGDRRPRAEGGVHEEVS